MEPLDVTIEDVAAALERGNIPVALMFFYELMERVEQAWGRLLARQLEVEILGVIHTPM